MSKKTESLPHELAPAHRVMSDDEKRKLLEKFKVTSIHFPKIFASDPALGSIDAKVGDIIHIRRRDAVGENDYYRVVIK